MKKLSKWDRNGVRNAVDVERRYKLGIIEPTADEVEELKESLVVDDYLSTTSTNAVQNKIITQNLNNKVTKETGKGLSTNDFTNEHKKASHTHSNKVILDNITVDDINKWNTEPKILWTNPNPNNSFAAQVLSIPELSNYDMYEIIFKQISSVNRQLNTGKIQVGAGFILCYVTTSNYLRASSSASDTELGFEDAKQDGTVNNNLCIPLYIIGYKTGLFQKELIK